MLAPSSRRSNQTSVPTDSVIAMRCTAPVTWNPYADSRIMRPTDVASSHSSIALLEQDERAAGESQADPQQQSDRAGCAAGARGSFSPRHALVDGQVKRDGRREKRHLEL